MSRNMNPVKLVSLLVVILLSGPAAAQDPFQEARENSLLSQSAFGHCWRYLHGWLAHRDPESGLLPRKLNDDFYWNAKDSAADNYPFLVLTASILDARIQQTTLKEMLQTEIRLTNRLGNLPVARSGAIQVDGGRTANR